MLEEEIMLKANCVTNESLESTRRMLQMAEESLGVGNKTMTMLNEQGEQLMNIKQEVDHINQDIKQAQKNLNELSRCCCLWPFYRLRLKKKDRSNEQARLQKKSKQEVESSHLTSVHKVQADSGPYINRITNDKKENEIEENLQETGNMVWQLKCLALEMGNEIEKQNQDIKDITEEVIKHTENVVDVEEQARKHH